MASAMTPNIPHIANSLVNALSMFTSGMQKRKQIDRRISNIFLKTTENELHIEEKPGLFHRLRNAKLLKTDAYKIEKNAEILTELIKTAKTAGYTALSDLQIDEKQNLLNFARACQKTFDKFLKPGLFRRIFSRKIPTEEREKIKSASKQMKLLIDSAEKEIVADWAQLNNPIEMLQSQSKNGNSHATLQLGILYMDGGVVKTDLKRAEKLLTQAAKAGNRSAMNKMKLLIQIKYGRLISAINRKAKGNLTSSQEWAIQKLRKKCQEEADRWQK